MASNKVTNMVNYDLPNGKHETPNTFENKIENKNIDELIEETDDDLLEPIDGLKIKTHDDRMRSDNRMRSKNRYTKSCEYPEENLQNKFSTKLSASLPDHFYLNSFASKNWAKKFSKNSRRSRKERNRGLAKKGRHRLSIYFIM